MTLPPENGITPVLYASIIRNFAIASMTVSTFAYFGTGIHTGKTVLRRLEMP
jgi:hypothetical protein